jgi:hypothetical protein
MWEGTVEPGDWLLSVNGTPVGAANQLAQVLAGATSPRTLRFFREKASPNTNPQPTQQRQRKKKPKNSPQNPRSAYIFFFEDMRRVITCNSHDARIQIGQAWSQLAEDARVHYYGKAEADRQRFQEEQQAWKLHSPRSSMPTAQAKSQHGGQQSPLRGFSIIDKSPTMSMFERMRKHPDAPKKVVEAYVFFSQVMRPKLLASNPGIKPIDASRKLGLMWKAMTPRVKAVYYAQEKLDRVRYQDMMARWTHVQLQLTANGHANPMSVDYYNSLMSSTSTSASGGGRGGSPASKKQRTSTKSAGPRKPISGYIYFSSVMRSRLTNENPKMSPVDASKMLGKMWKGLGPKAREPYAAVDQLDRLKLRQLNAQWSQAELAATVAIAKVGGVRDKAAVSGGPPDLRKSAKAHFGMLMRPRVAEAMPIDAKAADVDAIVEMMWRQLHLDVKQVYEAQAKQSEARYKEAVASWATAQFGVNAAAAVGDNTASGKGASGAGNAKVAAMVAEQQRLKQLRDAGEAVRKARLKWPEMVSSGLIKAGDKVLTARITGQEFHADLKHNRYILPFTHYRSRTLSLLADAHHSTIHFDGQIFIAVTSFASYCREKKMGKEPKCNGFICTYYNGLSLHDIRENAAIAAVAASKGPIGGSVNAALNLTSHALAGQQHKLLQSQGGGRTSIGRIDGPAGPGGICRACAYGRHEAHVFGCPKRRARPTGPRKRKAPPSAEALQKAQEAAGGNNDSICKACLFGRHEAHALGCAKRRPKQQKPNPNAVSLLQVGQLSHVLQRTAQLSQALRPPPPQQPPQLAQQQGADLMLELQKQQEMQLMLQQQRALQQAQQQQMQQLMEQRHQPQMMTQQQVAQQGQQQGQQEQQPGAGAPQPWVV